ncbi:MAG: flavin reductase family protein [Rhodospirillaceae bacterium]|nr:flavin reductase family protein [Rhodospirillaceae bacterium]
MDIAAEDLTPGQLYKLLTSTVMPRPIALVSTRDAGGTVNVAPFSFFNVFSEAPPLLILGIEGSNREGAGQLKDTSRNIAAQGEFVVNLVSREIADQMVACAVPFPEGVSELREAGLTPRASKQVAVPGVAESPVSFECRLFASQTLPQGRNLITGEIVHIHVRDHLIDENLTIDVAALDVVGRMNGNGWYCTTRDRFQIPNMTVAAWRAKKGGGAI